jgi:hypothetical protein
MPIPAAVMDALPKASIHQTKLFVKYSLLLIFQQTLNLTFAYKNI